MQEKAKPFKQFIFYVLIVLLGIYVFAYIFKGYFFPRPVGKIALVIDDWGYNQAFFGLAKKINAPLTCSILPNLPYSRVNAETLKKSGCEILLHLPLEPQLPEYKYISLESETIMTYFPKEKVLEALRKDLKELEPFVSGVSNHMGSRASEDEKLMGIIFQELKKRKLYFLDSFVTPNTVCPDLAQKMKVKFAIRSIFLDNLRDKKCIKGQLETLVMIAHRNKEAIGIGHACEETLSVLIEEVPALKKRGFKFVFVSELAK